MLKSFCRDPSGRATMWDVLSASTPDCCWLSTGVQSGFRANYAQIRFSSSFFSLQTSGGATLIRINSNIWGVTDERWKWAFTQIIFDISLNTIEYFTRRVYRAFYLILTSTLIRSYFLSDTRKIITSTKAWCVLQADIYAHTAIKKEWSLFEWDAKAKKNKTDNFFVSSQFSAFCILISFKAVPILKSWNVELIF